MSASAHVLALVRAHYAGDERAFVEGARALADASKSIIVKNAITDAIRNRKQAPKPQPKAQLPPHASLDGMLESVDVKPLDELVLPEALRAELDEVALEIEYREALRERGLRPRNRLLFTGPPGCGKTSASAALAGRVSLTPYAVSLPTLISKWVGETGQNIGKLFSALSDDRLLIFDELDAIGSSRGDVSQSAGKEFNSKVNTLLTLLDRRAGGFLVATTNRVDILDPALVRRFDLVLEFPAPTDAQKIDLARRLSERFGVEPINDETAAACEHYAAVEKLCEREARRAVMREVLSSDEEE